MTSLYIMLAGCVILALVVFFVSHRQGQKGKHTH